MIAICDVDDVTAGVQSCGGFIEIDSELTGIGEYNKVMAFVTQISCRVKYLYRYFIRKARWKVHDDPVVRWIGKAINRRFIIDDWHSLGKFHFSK